MDVEGSAEDLAKRIVDLEAQWNQWKEEKVKLKEEVINVKAEEERMKNKYMKMKGKCLEIRREFDSEKVKWKEENKKIRERYWKVEAEKGILTIDLEEKDSKITKLLEMIEEFEREKKAYEEEVKKILEEKLAAEAEKKTYEEEMKKITAELMNKNEALEMEKKVMESEMMKTKMEAQVSELQKEKSEEASAKKRLEEVEVKNSELGKMIVEYEREKKAMQEEVSKLMREKSEEVKKMLKEEIAAETKKKAYEEEAKLSAIEIIFPEFDQPVEEAQVSNSGRGKKRKQWSTEEHELFLKGIKAFGDGHWKKISKHFVTTRTHTQIASHAQKYYLRRHSNGSGNAEKKRKSINDITLENQTDSMI